MVVLSSPSLALTSGISPGPCPAHGPWRLIPGSVPRRSRRRAGWIGVASSHPRRFRVTIYGCGPHDLGSSREAAGALQQRLGRERRQTAAQSLSRRPGLLAGALLCGQRADELVDRLGRDSPAPVDFETAQPARCAPTARSSPGRGPSALAASGTVSSFFSTIPVTFSSRRPDHDRTPVRNCDLDPWQRRGLDPAAEDAAVRSIRQRNRLSSSVEHAVQHTAQHIVGHSARHGYPARGQSPRETGCGAWPGGSA